MLKEFVFDRALIYERALSIFYTAILNPHVSVPLVTHYYICRTLPLMNDYPHPNTCRVGMAKKVRKQ